MKARVLRALWDAGFTDVELWYDHSACQWVFSGPSTVHWSQTGTAVYRMSDLTVEQWVELAQVLSTATA